jgi:hypothetical protein
MPVRAGQPAIKARQRVPVDSFGGVVDREKRSRGMGFLSGANEQDGLDFHGHAMRERPHADRRTGMASWLAEHLDEQIGAPVDHLGVVGEVGLRVDHAEQLDHGIVRHT